MSAYLDKTGLTYLWAKIKAHLAANYAPKIHTHGTITVHKPDGREYTAPLSEQSIHIYEVNVQ